MKCYNFKNCPDFENERFLCCFAYQFCKIRKKIDYEDLQVRSEINRLARQNDGHQLTGLCESEL